MEHATNFHRITDARLQLAKFRFLLSFNAFPLSPILNVSPIPSLLSSLLLIFDEFGVYWDDINVLNAMLIYALLHVCYECFIMYNE